MPNTVRAGEAAESLRLFCQLEYVAPEPGCERSGERRVQSIAIEPEVVDPEDVEMLQDLVMAAINEGLEQVDRNTAERMSSLTGGLDVPGLL